MVYMGPMVATYVAVAGAGQRGARRGPTTVGISTRGWHDDSGRTHRSLVQSASVSPLRHSAFKARCWGAEPLCSGTSDSRSSSQGEDERGSARVRVTAWTPIAPSHFSECVGQVLGRRQKMSRVEHSSVQKWPARAWRRGEPHGRHYRRGLGALETKFGFRDVGSVGKSSWN